MNKSKSRVILIIAIILIVISAIGATIAVLYINTDLFKSEKELFYKYMVQNDKVKKLISFSELDDYIKKSDSIAHAFDTSIKLYENNSENTASNNNEVNTFNIQINGKTMPVNQDKSIDLKLKYNDTDLFHASMIKNNDLFGILSEEIVTKYVAIENNNLKELAKKIGIENTDNIPNTFNTNIFNELFNLSEEQKTNIINVYKPILMDNIPDSNFTKQKDVPLLLNNNNISTTTYSLKLSNIELNNLIKNILIASKNSEVIINIIKDKARTLGYNENDLSVIVQTYQDNIQDILNHLNMENSENEAIRIVLYTSNKQLLKTDVMFDERTIYEFIFTQNDSQTILNVNMNQKDTTNQIIIQISKSLTADKKELDITINASGNDEQTEILVKAEKNGELESNVIKNTFSLGINNRQRTYRIDYTNTENYTENINIEKLNSSNSVTLNNYQGEDIKKLLEAIAGRMEQVIQEKINLLQSMNASLNTPFSLFLNSTNVVEQSATAMTSLEIQAFNSQFMPYSSSDAKAGDVKALISLIIASNTSFSDDSSKQISLTYGQFVDVSNPQELKNISEAINTTLKYKISLSYSQEGIVNKIMIEENAQ